MITDKLIAFCTYLPYKPMVISPKGRTYSLSLRNINGFFPERDLAFALDNDCKLLLYSPHNAPEDVNKAILTSLRALHPVNFSHVRHLAWSSIPPHGINIALRHSLDIYNLIAQGFATDISTIPNSLIPNPDYDSPQL